MVHHATQSRGEYLLRAVSTRQEWRDGFEPDDAQLPGARIRRERAELRMFDQERGEANRAPRPLCGAR